MYRKRGFTLIELLVVIAVIVILAAILFPVFAHVREKARSATCVSNLRQIGHGYMLYVQDWDEQFPLAAQAPERQLSVYWSPPELVSDPQLQAMYRTMGANAIYPYTRSYEIWACPSSLLAEQLPGDLTYHQFTPGVKPTEISYQFNGLLGALSMADVSHPSLVPLVWEGPENRRFVGSNVNNPTAKVWFFTRKEDRDKLPTPESGWPFRQAHCGTGLLGTMLTSRNTVARLEVHNGGWNWLYADGHVEWKKRGSTGAGDPWQDPFIYNEDGTSLTYWQDECERPWLFRPDLEPNDHAISQAPFACPYKN
jgi:prepilin-type N-terminal cleavage/methylation domain-containing protein/prepilin-type processing-associated H-X9-DG protein